MEDAGFDGGRRVDAGRRELLGLADEDHRAGRRDGDGLGRDLGRHQRAEKRQGSRDKEERSSHRGTSLGSRAANSNQAEPWIDHGEISDRLEEAGPGRRPSLDCGRPPWQRGDRQTSAEILATNTLSGLASFRVRTTVHSRAMYCPSSRYLAAQRLTNRHLSILRSGK